ncbi:MerR family transcriptional regulator [Kribbella sp. NBC_01505]|uniref:helix-turn-helix domain-containing protein n=1 Tax=Kribbella sp. NBC_01505 TaxID=2903580 RepID=UPI00386A4EFE
MGDLTSIRVAADHFGVPLSTLHYWERQGMLRPVRSAGTRWYDADQLYRIAMIKLWRERGQLSIGDIGAVLAAPVGERRTVVADRIRQIQAQRAELDHAEQYLHALLGCPEPHEPDRCPEFRAEVSLPTRSVALS